MGSLALFALLVVACAWATGRDPDPLASPSSVATRPVDLQSMASRQLQLQGDFQDLQERIEALQRDGEWRERGYFTGPENEAVEWLLFRFVTIHHALWGEIDRLGGAALAPTDSSQQANAHLLVLHAGLALADSSSFLVSRFRDDPVAIAKLNEAFPRSEIPAGTYDRLSRALHAPDRRRTLATAWRLHEADLADPAGSAVAEAASTSPALAAVLAELPALHGRVSERLARLDTGSSEVEVALGESLAAAAVRESGRLLDRLGSETRALVFTDVSRLKSPTAHLIVFTPEQKRVLHAQLRAGDLILTYTAGYVSSALIPGVFKHGITYVGDPGERTAAGLTPASLPDLADPLAEAFARNLARARLADGKAADLIEAVAEGVKFSNLDHILDTHVNRLLVLRPQLEEAERTAFLAETFSFLGEPYDFRFDFADASRQVCTEVIYRALDGKQGIRFALTRRAGHPTLSADDIVLHHLASPGQFRVIAYAEEDPASTDHAARLWLGQSAAQRLTLRMGTSDR